MGPTFKQHGVFSVMAPLLTLLCLLLFAERLFSAGGAPAPTVRSVEQAYSLTADVETAWIALSDYVRKPTDQLHSRYLEAARKVPNATARLVRVSAGDDSFTPIVSRLSTDAVAVMAALSRAAQLSKPTNGHRTAIDPESRPYRDQIDKLRSDLAFFEAFESTRESRDRAATESRTFRRLFFAACTVSLISLVLFGTYVRRVQRRLFNLTARARRLADGKDLDRAPNGKDEVSQLHSIYYDMAHAHALTLRREGAVLKNAVDVVCSITPAGVFTKISPACLKVWGYRPAELVGRHISEVVAPAQIKPMSEMLKRACSGQPVTDFESGCCRKDGSAAIMNWSAFLSELGDVVYCVAHDITERKQMEMQTWHKAYHDSLTALPNRLLFHDRLDVAVAMAQRENAILAVMFMDLDRFKAVNDTLGHEAGDALLKEVADRLRTCLRRSDTVARLGGDEFTILLPKIAHADDAAIVARKVNEALNNPWVYGDQQVRISGSLGIAIFPRDASEPDDLLKRADTAQYQIKSHGKNGFLFYEPQMVKTPRPDDDRNAALELVPAGSGAAG